MRLFIFTKSEQKVNSSFYFGAFCAPARDRRELLIFIVPPEGIMICKGGATSIRKTETAIMVRKWRGHSPKPGLSTSEIRGTSRGWAMKFFCLIALLSLSTGYAQTPTVTTRTTVVLVPALVRSRAGAPVFTLKAADFTLTDDGIEQKTTVEEDTGSEPLALVVAIETGGAGAGQLDKIRNLGPSIEAVIGSVPHRVAVVEFDSSPRLAQEFTSDLNTVADTLHNLEPGDRGSAILDGLWFSVDLVRRQPAAYRRAILLISDTVDHGSRIKLEDALHAVSGTNTAIYSLAFSSTKSAVGHEAGLIMNDPTPGPPGGCMAKDPNAQPGDSRWVQAIDCLGLLAPPLRLAKRAAIAAADGLQRNVPESVAQLTGGEYFKFSDARSLEKDVLTISHHLPNRYVLSFHPLAPHPGFHAVVLRLNEHSNLVVQARNGYWADEEAAAATKP
jgi:VWFA-related protein